MPLPPKRQLHIEFGLTAPVRVRLLGLEFENWSSRQIVELEQLQYLVDCSDSATVLACAWQQPDLSTEAKYNALKSLPYATLLLLEQGYAKLYADYSAMYAYVKRNARSLRYLLETGPADTLIKATVLDLLRDARQYVYLAELEKSLGIRWTPSMAHRRGEGSGSVTKPNEFFQPLALLLSDDGKKLMEFIRKHVRAPNEPPPEPATDSPASTDKAAPSASTPRKDDNKIYIRKMGETMESLMTADRETFKQRFSDIPGQIHGRDSKDSTHE